MDRIVFLIDMDCFYVQVEQRSRPETIEIVPSTLEEDGLFPLDLTEPNEESFVVLGSGNAETGNEMSTSLNRSDWIALLRSSFHGGQRYAYASALTYKIRKAILKHTGFRCSAGIAANKTLAKLACSLNKPNKQTIVPPEAASVLLRATPIGKIRNLGGKLGAAVSERLSVQTLGELSELSLNRLTEEFGEKTASWLYDLCRGHDSESVTPRSIAQSIGCSKNFLGASALTGPEQVEHWLNALSDELLERLSEDRRTNQRYASRLTLYVRTNDATSGGGGGAPGGQTFSRVLPSSLLSSIARADECDQLESPPTSSSSHATEVGSRSHDVIKRIVRSAFSVIEETLGSERVTGITCLGLGTGKFYPLGNTSSTDIRTLFGKRSPKKDTQQAEPVSKSDSEPPSEPTISNNPPPRSFFKRVRMTETSSSLSTEAAHSIPTPNAVTIPDSVNLPPIQPESNSLPPFEVEHNADSNSSTKSDTVPFFTSYSVGDWTVCEECGSRVSIWQIPEHSDFHLAQRLQQEWSDEQQPRGPSVASSSNAPTRPGNTAGRAKKTIHNKPRGITTLDRFITKRSS